MKVKRISNINSIDDEQELSELHKLLLNELNYLSVFLVEIGDNANLEDTIDLYLDQLSAINKRLEELSRQ